MDPADGVAAGLERAVPAGRGRDALLTAFVSSAVFGLSLALGAFVAGIVVSESDVSYQAAAEVIPFRDLFAVLFFVSVGMLVDPEALLRRRRSSRSSS